MTTLSSVIGSVSPPAPVGGFVRMIGESNPTLEGYEYLRTGVLKPIAGYPLVPTPATHNLALSTVLAGVGQQATQTILYAGTSYYVIGQSMTPRYSTDFTTWQASAGASTFSDLVVFGGRVVQILASGSDQNSLLNGVNTLIPAAVPPSGGGALAVNSAGTLGVIAFRAWATAGDIFTSTDGLTFTSQTSSVSSGSSVVAAAWSPTAAAFIYLNNTGVSHTTADGFTLTARGVVVTGATAVAVQSPASAYSASSPTSTIFSVDLTVAGVATRSLLRTTNGAAYSSTLVSSFSGTTPTTPPRIEYIDGAYFLYLFSDTATQRVCHKSTDDGLTWVQVPAVVNPSGLAVSSLAFANNEYLSAACGTPGQLASKHSAFFNATHVGSLKKVIMPAVSATDEVVEYMRIK